MAQVGSGLMAKPGNFSSDFDDFVYEEQDAPNRKQKKPGPGYRPGIDPEFTYFNQGGLASLRYQEGGDMNMAGEPNDKELIADAVEAIKGMDPNPKVALAAFVARYGEEALRDLVKKVNDGEFDTNKGVSEGMLNGVGDGMDDMIPATMEGQQDVVLSDGEFIVPADVVSGLGNGSSDAGSEALYDMMDRVRMMRTGKKEQPKQVPLGNMMPA